MAQRWSNVGTVVPTMGQRYPNLFHCRAVVLAFYLPGISSINLTRDHVVGIYNGTYREWNHPSLQEINHVDLPAAPIKVIARADKSGTTELFTSALSAFNANWESTFGTFSAGLDDDQPVVWDPGVVSYYGQTNAGVSGLILSIKYAIGYLAVADALDFDMTYALLVNKEGYVVDAGTADVQAAMDYYASSFSERMTASLSDAGGDQAYPIAGYTYFIIHLHIMQSCEWVLLRAQ